MSCHPNNVECNPNDTIRPDEREDTSRADDQDGTEAEEGRGLKGLREVKGPTKQEREDHDRDHIPSPQTMC